MMRTTVAAALALALAGCTAPAGPDPTTGTPQARAGASPTAATTPDAPATATDAPAPDTAIWDPSTWEPTVQIQRIPMTDAEREALYAEQLERHAEGYGLVDPPQVQRIGWAQSLAEYGDRRAQCLRDAGFPQAVSDGLGGTIFDPGIPPSQDQALNEASYICDAQYPADPVLSQDWSTDQLRLVYDYWDQYYIPCMAAHGHEISREDQPSREVWVAAFHTADRISWWPNDASMVLPHEERRALGLTCPEYPPPAAMYGG